MNVDSDNKYTVIRCDDDPEKSLNLLFKKYVLDVFEEEAEASIKRFQEIEQTKRTM